MDAGVIGAIFLSAVSPAEEGTNLKPDSATVRHLLMEEQIAQEKILFLWLAIYWNALVKN
jgi:hypothetical protein